MNVNVCERELNIIFVYLANSITFVFFPNTRVFCSNIFVVNDGLNNAFFKFFKNFEYQIIGSINDDSDFSEN